MLQAINFTPDGATTAQKQTIAGFTANNATTAQKQAIARWGIPDYTKAIAIANGFKSTEDGVVMVSFNWSKTYYTAKVYGMTFVSQNNTSSNGQQSAGMCIFPEGYTDRKSVV